MGAASRAIRWPTAAEPVKDTAPIRRSRGQRDAHLGAPGHQLHRGLRRAAGAQGLAEEVHQPQGGQRGLRGGLGDDRAAGGQRRRDLVRGEQQRVVEARDAHHHADRLAGPEAEQPLTRRQQVQRHRLPVQPGHFLGRRQQGEQGAVHLDAAVDQRLAGLQDQEPFEVRAPGGDRLVGREQRGPAGVRGEPADLLADREGRVDRLRVRGRCPRRGPARRASRRRESGRPRWRVPRPSGRRWEDPRETPSPRGVRRWRV